MIKNVVIICENTDTLNGVDQVAIEQASLMAKRGINVYYFAACGEPVQKINERLLSSDNIHVTSLGYYPIKYNPSRLQAILLGIYNFKAARELKKLLSTLDNSDTVIHFHTWMSVFSSSVIKAALDMNFKIFITLHDYRLACPNMFLFNYPKKEICEIKSMSLKCLLCNCDMRHYSYKVWRYICTVILKIVLRKNTNRGRG